MITLEHNTSSPAALRPHQPDRRHQGHLPRLSAAHLPGWRAPKRNSARSTRTRRNTSTRYWKETGELARKLGGHGGMDFVMAYRLVQCMREGTAPDIDVYDAAAGARPGPLSEASVAKGSAPMKFPDFTRGRWQKRA